MNVLKGLACGLAVFLAGAALADGVPLFSSGPPLKQAAPPGHPEHVGTRLIRLNANAFGANVLTVVVDGKEHRFVGRMMADVPPGRQVWSGTEGSLGMLTLSKNSAGVLFGTMHLPPRRTFQFGSASNVMVEIDRTLAAQPRSIDRKGPQ